MSLNPVPAVGGREWEWEHDGTRFSARATDGDDTVRVLFAARGQAAFEYYSTWKTFEGNPERTVISIYEETTGDGLLVGEVITPLYFPGVEVDGRTAGIHLRVAETLLATLRVLNAVDTDNRSGLDTFYANDNTAQASKCPGTELRPYAHVQAALLASLGGLVGDRAERLYEEIVDNGEDVAYNLALLPEL